MLDGEKNHDPTQNSTYRAIHNGSPFYLYRGTGVEELPMKRTPVTVDFCVMDDMFEPFICGVDGGVTLDELKAIEKEFIDNHQDNGCHQDGNYRIKCSWYSGQYDEMGRCELSPGWELDLIGFEPLPVGEES